MSRPRLGARGATGRGETRVLILLSITHTMTNQPAQARAPGGLPQAPAHEMLDRSRDLVDGMIWRSYFGCAARRRLEADGT